MSSFASFMGHMLIMENVKLHNDKLYTIIYRNREEITQIGLDLLTTDQMFISNEKTSTVKPA
jgi:hypothetical protein